MELNSLMCAIWKVQQMPGLSRLLACSRLILWIFILVGIMPLKVWGHGFCKAVFQLPYSYRPAKWLALVNAPVCLPSTRKIAITAFWYWAPSRYVLWTWVGTDLSPGDSADDLCSIHLPCRNIMSCHPDQPSKTEAPILLSARSVYGIPASWVPLWDMSSALPGLKCHSHIDQGQPMSNVWRLLKA